MPVIKLDYDIVEELVDTKKVDSTFAYDKRWAAVWNTVFEYEGKFYRVETFRASGDGNVDFLCYSYDLRDEPIECTEVKPVEKTIITYEPVD